jgi:hypothetical protein
MVLSLRRTGFSSPAYADRHDYNVIENGRVIGRIYEQLYVPDDVRWFWSITAFHVDPAFNIATGACRAWNRLRDSFVRVGVRCVRRYSQKNGGGCKPTPDA